ncbi:MAG: hypothetical protein IT365_17285 [Candidatus Hydrogenedentes bacterium]|nr:hypothetical protein [Candidatus Hydrogenedentota bacterium]
MTSISAEIGPGERMELRDGIFYYVKQSRSRGTVALAAPKARVDVVHRAEHRRIRRSKIEGAGFWLVLILLFYLLPVVFEPSPARALIAAGILTLVLVFFSADVFAWRLKSGRVQTEIVVDTERRKIPILFTRVQGEDPDLESLLDRLQRCDELEAVPPKGCAVEFAESWWDWFRIFGYSAGLALLGWGCILAEDEESLVGELLLFISGCVVLTALVLSYAMNHPIGVAVRAARGAMLDGEVETAALMAKAILQKRPYHFYANYLMTFHAVMTGNLEAAAQHRDAMDGNTGRERLSIFIAGLTRDLSSAPAFRVLADYARGASRAAEDARCELVSS